MRSDSNVERSIGDGRGIDVVERIFWLDVGIDERELDIADDEELKYKL